MEIIHSNPPNIENISLVFPVTEHTVYAYGDKIYNPNKIDIRPDIIYHENIHSKQQNGDPESWWNRYLTDVDFRLEQELEAYAEQYLFIKKRLNGRIASEFRKEMAQNLSSPLYQFDLTSTQADTLIRRKAKQTLHG